MKNAVSYGALRLIGVLLHWQWDILTRFISAESSDPIQE